MAPIFLLGKGILENGGTLEIVWEDGKKYTIVWGDKFPTCGCQLYIAPCQTHMPPLKQPEPKKSFWKKLQFWFS